MKLCFSTARPDWLPTTIFPPIRVRWHHLQSNGAGAFAISGNEINLSSGVTNNSANPQTISANLNNSGANKFITRPRLT